MQSIYLKPPNPLQNTPNFLSAYIVTGLENAWLKTRRVRHNAGLYLNCLATRCDKITHMQRWPTTTLSPPKCLPGVYKNTRNVFTARWVSVAVSRAVIIALYPIRNRTIIWHRRRRPGANRHTNVTSPTMFRPRYLSATWHSAARQTDELRPLAGVSSPLRKAADVRHNLLGG